MNWIRIKPTDKIPRGNLLATDGKTLSIQYNGIRDPLRPVGTADLTHYILLEDIPLPKGPEDV